MKIAFGVTKDSKVLVQFLFPGMVTTAAFETILPADEAANMARNLATTAKEAATRASLKGRMDAGPTLIRP